jgi:LacI family transcriptional regulator
MMDVAEKAQVSVMTVSRVLNLNSPVSESTRTKVMQAVEALSYKPNLAGRTLASKRSFAIGLLYHNPSQSYVNKFLIGAMNSCRSVGYHLIIDECCGSVEHNMDIVYSLINDTQVDGVIMLPPVSDSMEFISVLKENKVPLIRIAPDRNLDESPYVCMDDYSASYDIVTHMIKKGHTKIGFIIGHPNQGVSRLRYQGYLDALRSHQIHVPAEYIEQGFFDYKSGLDAAEKLLALEERPTAIFASNDDMAAAVVAAAHKHKMDVPKDIAVAGFDDTEIASIVWPQLTTIQQPIEEMASESIRILAKNISSPKEDASHADYRHVLDYKLITRASTAGEE